MRAGWLVLGLAVASVLAASLFSPGFVFLAALLNFAVGLIILLPILAVVRITRGKGPLWERAKLPEGLSLAVSLVALGLSAGLPWAVALADGADRIVGLMGAALVAVAILIAARQVTAGWAILASIALVFLCFAAWLLSHGLAEWVGWQDLHWRSTTDDPMDGSSVDIGWGLIGAAVFAPIAGIVLGIASQLNKRERAAA